MKIPHTTRMFAVTLVLLTLAGTANAQLGAGFRRNSPDRAGQREEIEENMANIFLFRLQQELKLEKSKALDLFDLLEKSRARKKPLRREFVQKLRELRTLVEAETPDEKAVTQTTDRIMGLRTELHQADIDLMKSLDKVLTPVEKGKFVLFYTAFLKKLGKFGGHPGGDFHERPRMGPRGEAGQEGPGSGLPLPPPPGGDDENAEDGLF